MPASREAVQLTNVYRSRILALRQQAAARALAAWRLLDPRNLDETFAQWQAATAVSVEATKREGVTLANAYLASYVAAEVGGPVLSPTVTPAVYTATAWGATLEHALRTPRLTVLMAMKAGRRDDALQLGAARATRLVSEEASDAPRRALADLMQQSGLVVAYRRVTSADACLACLALADGETVEPDEAIHRHAHCRCHPEPVVRGVRERFTRPTGRHIFDALSPAEAAARYGAKAELIRTGAVPLEALVKRDAQAVTPDQFTERPLGALRALANRP